MTLKVVVDNDSNVTDGGFVNLRNIPDVFRRLANEAEEGLLGDVRSVIVIMDLATGPETCGWGEVDNPLMAVGLIELAKTKFIAETLAGSDE